MSPPTWNNTCTVDRLSRQPVIAGGLQETYISHLAGVSCRFQQGSPIEDQTIGDRADLIGILYAPDPTDIVRGDRITVNGITGYVHGASVPSVPNAYLKVILESKQPTQGLP